MFTELQKKTAQAIVQIFETSKIKGDYSAVTVMAGDSGHISYGKAQASLMSGNLGKLLKEYITIGGDYASELSPYLLRAIDMDISLDDDKKFNLLLKQAGHDKIMQECQDALFEVGFWLPAMRIMSLRNYKFALSAAVIYDSRIHGAWGVVRDIVNTKHGYTGYENTAETQYIQHYVSEREHWLANHKNPILHKTVYRMQEFEKLLAVNNWDLVLPITVRGLKIIEDVLV
ncbi:chitosanase [Patescibacteria group bacterium]|nr:chitosanase [Patescibacteria group bacterium]MBU0879863.1 chitosanase [Patescibacteria group bacterium]MBU1992017.1 chitosanase [Patescibacteria group bacterium]MBU2251800.1 chitosanase [Candidatus Omnitrophota bacterium]MBU2474294.1 chitosanase [Candidatus Omnitrophota bacterium]